MHPVSAATNRLIGSLPGYVGYDQDLGVAACLLKHGHLLQPMERIKHDDNGDTIIKIMIGRRRNGVYFHLY